MSRGVTCRARVMWGHVWSRGVIWVTCGHVWSRGVAWSHVGSRGVTWGHVGSRVVMWGHVGSCAMRWSCTTCSIFLPIISRVPVMTHSAAWDNHSYASYVCMPVSFFIGHPTNAVSSACCFVGRRVPVRVPLCARACVCLCACLLPVRVPVCACARACVCLCACRHAACCAQPTRCSIANCS